MRYLMLVKGPEKMETPPPQALFDAIDQSLQEGLKDGTVLSFGGLQPTAKGARAMLKNGKVTVIDGPFSEAKEVIGGFTIFQLKDKAEAIRLTEEFLEM